MQKGIFLVHIATISVKDLGVTCVNDILDNMGELVDLGLDVFEDFVLCVLLAFQAVHSHHILFANLIKTFSHLDLQLVLKSLEFLDLNKLDVFQRAAGRLAPFGVQHFGE
jgi:hypothetical protein